jgi:hypothetical protein
VVPFLDCIRGGNGRFGDDDRRQDLQRRSSVQGQTRDPYVVSTAGSALKLEIGVKPR